MPGWWDCQHLALSLVVLLLLLLGPAGRAQEETTRRPDRQVPTKPFRIIGNIYYVGQTDNSKPGSDHAAYLITTPEGHILLDTGLEETVPQIRNNVRALGFRFEEIKYLIHSHSHSDHVAGDALVKEAIPGIQLLAMNGDAAVIASGGEADFDEDRPHFKPAPVDRTIQDGHQLQLGGVTMVAHRTAGHTEGCTTRTTKTEENGRTYEVILVCSARISQGMTLVNNARYPKIAEDYASTYRLLKSVTPDGFLATHGFFFGMVEQARGLEQGQPPIPSSIRPDSRPILPSPKGTSWRSCANRAGACREVCAEFSPGSALLHYFLDVDGVI